MCHADVDANAAPTGCAQKIIMFMSTTDDRNHIGNEWTHDKKLSEVDAHSNNDRTYQNIHFSSFQQLVGLAVGQWFVIYFAHGAHESVDKKMFFFFAQGLKKTFLHQFWWVCRETRNKTIFFRPEI